MVGAAQRALKRARHPEAAKELADRVMGGEATDYHHALGIIQEYVDFDL